MKTFQMEFSNSPTSGFVSAGTFTVANASGPQYLPLNAPVTARYYRITVTSNWDGTNDSAIGEVGVY